MAHTKKPSPDTGKVAAIAVGRGKSEQIRIVLKKPLLFVPYGRVVAERLRFFIIGAQKNFSCLSRKGAEKKSFLFACFVFSCPAKSSFTVSEEAEKVFDFGNGGKFLFHFADGII